MPWVDYTGCAMVRRSKSAGRMPAKAGFERAVRATAIEREFPRERAFALFDEVNGRALTTIPLIMGEEPEGVAQRFWGDDHEERFSMACARS